MPYNEEVQKLVVSIGTTLDRFISNRQYDFPYAKGELSQLLRDIGLAAKIVNKAIMSSGLIGIEGQAGDQNASGEDQQKLDVVAHIRFVRALTRGGEVCAILSEEEESMIDTGNHQAKYVIALDPLDGSSNIDVNLPIGSIFSVFRRKSALGGPPSDADILQNGNEQVAAGYIIYGSSNMLVYTTGHGVNGFTYDFSIGEYILSHPNIQSPTEGVIFSYNEGYFNDFSDEIKQYLHFCRSNHYTARYVGALVADFHRNLLKGGIYLYPATSKAPHGKLRLLFECYALAFLVEQAGGKASNGHQRILDIVPTHLHQRTPLIIGSAGMVDKVLEYVSKPA